MNTPTPLSRRRFLQDGVVVAATTLLARPTLAAQPTDPARSARPRCITMWDFSWIERRWPGAGYEDWPRILDELVERGYDAVRIDAFPHLIATAPEREWTLLPVWYVQDWGSPAVNKVSHLQARLHEFIALCKQRRIMVGLSTWYREDAEKTRLQITTPQRMAEQWNTTLAGIRRAGLIDEILYVDLCNEWPGDLWCPFFRNDPPELTWGGWYTDTSLRWMRAACTAVRDEFPELPVSFSFEPSDRTKLAGQDFSWADYFEPHLWMAQANDGEFTKAAGYKYDRYSLDSYQSFVEKAERLYRSRPEYWQNLLRTHILQTAQALKPYGRPLMTTECWGVVDFKDWPLLNWDWVKDLCRLGVETAAGTGQWAAIATSNFAGPQFRGMWRDVAWHQSANALIRQSPLRPELRTTKLAARL
jgi:hypothetical protein